MNSVLLLANAIKCAFLLAEHFRKEVFSPAEQISGPQAAHLIFCQIVFDAYSPLCIRLTQAERKQLTAFLDEHDIDPQHVHR